MKATEIPLQDILVDYNKNPRGEIDPKAVDELLKSIVSVYELSGTQKTLLQPIVVRPINSEKHGYELRFGYHRYAAFEKASRIKSDKYAWASRIPCVIDDHDMDDEEGVASLAFALIENLQRFEMSPIDEALAIQTMIRDFQYKQKEIAELLGKSKGWVSQRVSLMNLDPTVHAALSAGKIGHSHARELIKVESHEAQRELLEKGLEEEWQVDDWIEHTEKIRSQEKKDKKEAKKQKEEEPPAEPKGSSTPLTPPSAEPSAGYSVQRSPAEIKKVQEDIEWEDDVEEDPYKKGIRDACLWVLGLSELPLDN